jgi:NDP-sugar pyrophosphorylase family protein
MKAMIFAAGLGKRLGEITKSTPKALAEINGKSILRIAVAKLASHGFDQIIVNVHHFADMVENEIILLRKEGYDISVSDERDLLLETAGGLYKARWFFDDKPFLLYNTDIITDLDLAALYRFHIEKSGLATLAVRERKDNRLLLVTGEGLLGGWCNKATGEKIIAQTEVHELNEIAFSGIHVVSPGIFKYMEEGVYSMTALYLDLAANHKIYTCRHDKDYWFDVGTPSDLDEVRRFLGR